MIVFALRHADRTATGDDLSPAGHKRALLLARMLAESGVSVVFRSDAVRAARTVEPLKQKLGNALIVKEVGFQGPNGVASHIAKVVDFVKAQPAAAVVAVVSHSNTVGPILQGLGAGPVAPIGDNEFDKLFVLFRAPNVPASLTMLRYGAPTP
ncbi:MAG: histidine phosphatase family protein [Xanthobacteraceae bacterium]